MEPNPRGLPPVVTWARSNYEEILEKGCDVIGQFDMVNKVNTASEEEHDKARFKR